MFKWLKNLFKKDKDNVSTINVGKYDTESQIVDTKDELYNLYKSGIEVFVGKRVYCKETELTYTLTTIDFNNGDLIFIDPDRWPKENDIVMDVNSKLWEVKEMQGQNYLILTRKDGSYWETTIADIYGVVCLAYSLGNVTFL